MTEERSTLERKAAALGAAEHEWNELDFVGWKEFRRMAPAVIGLEIARLKRALAREEPGSERYNALIRARHEMRIFSDGLHEAGSSDLERRADHLRRALLALSLLAETSESLNYTIHRLRYVHDRLNLIY